MPIYINNIPVSSFNFPGGESHIQLPEEFSKGKVLSPSLEIKAYLYNNDEIFKLLLTVNALRKTHYRSAKLVLNLPYLPYARQDRICNKGESISIEVMAEIINSLGFSEVILWDPHSSISEILIKNSIVRNKSDIFHRYAMWDLLSEKCIVSPRSRCV